MNSSLIPLVAVMTLPPFAAIRDYETIHARAEPPSRWHEAMDHLVAGHWGSVELTTFLDAYMSGDNRRVSELLNQDPGCGYDAGSRCEGAGYCWRVRAGPQCQGVVCSPYSFLEDFRLDAFVCPSGYEWSPSNPADLHQWCTCMAWGMFQLNPAWGDDWRVFDELWCACCASGDPYCHEQLILYGKSLIQSHLAELRGCLCRVHE